MINEDTVRHSWQAFVAREAECWVVNPEEQVPLISPVFRDGSYSDFDAEYYRLHPTTWPYPERCSTSDQGCIAKLMGGKITQLIARLKTEGAQEPSLHFFAFASHTHFPEHNRVLTDARARHIVEQLQRNVTELHGCSIALDQERPGRLRGGCPVSIHLHAMGQMPDLLWAGVQGEASQRVVLAAVCGANVH